MLFRRRKTQELDIQDIEEAVADSGEADEEYGEEDLYDVPEEALFEEDSLFEEEGVFEEEESPSSFDEVPEPGPHEKLSPVETGAWEYIHGEPNEDYLTDTGNFRYDLDGPEGGIFLPEEEPEGEAKKPRVVHVRRKHKKHHYLLKFTIFCAAMAMLIAFLMSSYFSVNEIRVEGMTNYTAEQILTLSELRLGDNIFKTKTGKAEKRIEEDPHIARATIRRDLPKTLVITVEERLPAAQVAFGKEDNLQYAVVDASGYILSVGEKDAAAAELIGFTVKGEHISAGTDLTVKEGAALDETMSLLKAAAAEGITFTKMDMSDKTVRLYFTDTLLIKGRPAIILEHIKNGDVTLILKDLAGKNIQKGTINASGEGSFTFSPAVE